MAKPILIDLFCGQGGASRGYADAGFEVVGVDIEDKVRARYPYPLFSGDWYVGLQYWLGKYPTAVAHASPPCQAYTTGGRTNRAKAPRLIEPVRNALACIVRSYVIENVPESPLIEPIMLCGSMFGLGVRRHRLFELGGFLPPAPLRCDHKKQGPIVGVYGHPHGKRGAWPGMKPSTLETWSEAMGIDWMDARGLSQAIPPAYTRWIGEGWLESLA